MDRREFLATAAALPLLRFEPWLPSDGIQELVLPDDLAKALARHCGLPLEEREVRSPEAATIAEAISIKGGAVFVYATDRDKFDYPQWSWCITHKRWKQLAIVEQIATAGEFTVSKRGGLFILQTTRCKIPSFRSSNRRLIVDFDDEAWWPEFGGGLPSVIRGNELHFRKQDWCLLAIDLFVQAATPDFFDGDVLKATITRQIADRLMQPDIDPDPWPELGIGWKEIGAWLAEGECLFVPFPREPMI